MKWYKAAVCLVVYIACSATTPITPPVYEFPTVSTISSASLYGAGESYVYVDGYTYPGDGGGGYFFSTGLKTCTYDGGTVVLDHDNYCYYRANPTNDVHEWGAYCDVVSVDNPGVSSPIYWEIVDMIRNSVWFEYAV